MKFLVTLALVALATARASDYSRFENFNDVDEVVNNHRLMIATVKCFIGEGRCTPESADMKKLIPDALQNSCGQCSEKQKALVARMMDAVIQKHPEEWKKLNKIHNPDGKYDEEIKNFIKEYANKSN